MNKIRNYILNGKGIAAKYLAILSLVLTIVITIFFSIIYNVAAEKIGVVPTRTGEIKIENGVIVSPEKQLIRDAFVFDDNMQLPLIIDTRTDSINTASLGTGVYLSRSKIYVKSDRKTEIYDYPETLTIEKRDYTDDIKSYNAYASANVFVITFFVVLFWLLLYTMLLSFVSHIVSAIIKKPLAFEQRMRLSAIVLIIYQIGSFVLKFAGITISFFTGLIIMAALQAVFMSSRDENIEILPPDAGAGK